MAQYGMAGGQTGREQAGALCYRHKNNEVQVLLIRTLEEDRWIIPKGRIKKGERPCDAAKRKAGEEAGAAGRVCQRSFGTYRYSDEGTLMAFLLRVGDSDRDPIPERKNGKRSPKWFTPEQARKALAEQREPEYAEELDRLIRDGVFLASRRIFIGHGHSQSWKELRDFLSIRLGLEWDEFNREGAAGLSTQERLLEMLDNAGFAFLVMTAEDQDAGGKMHARENVIHEAGLFQGRLGFKRAIILLEEGAAEFSNVHGLNCIRFPPRQIEATFDEVQRTLRREDLIGV